MLDIVHARSQTTRLGLLGQEPVDPVGTISQTKESSMKWFKRMITRWVREDWDNVGKELSRNEVEKLQTSRGLVRSNNDSIDGHAGLNITVMSAIGGKIITFRHYDRRKDDTQYRHYVIPDELDFERELGKMITMESIRQA
jgi:hypothetical protein